MESLKLSLIPACALLAGGALASYFRPGPRVSSGVQHFAAGIVFAAVAAELLPEIRASGSPLTVAVGFILGVLCLLAVKLSTEGFEEEEESEGPEAVSIAFLLGIAVDVFIDGLLVGIASGAGAKEGELLTIGLTFEVLFLGLSTATSMSRVGEAGRKIALVIGSLAALFVLGAVAGGYAMAVLPALAVVGVLSFGTAALLFLVTEELLVEAHESARGAWLAALFFAGFLLIIMLEMTA
ncbi:MAG: transporter [Candidatus Eremiobacteraeota bacterium]|nr:transporter [Candidatus Eremiobacteraeota bacterium]